MFERLKARAAERREMRDLRRRSERAILETRMLTLEAQADVLKRQMAHIERLEEERARLEDKRRRLEDGTADP